MEFQDTFFQMLAEGRNIREIVKYGAEVLGNPLMLLDSTFHVIAYHVYGIVEDDLWNDTIREGKKEIRKKYMEQVWVEELMREVHQKRKPIITDYDEKRIRRVVNQIMVGKRIIGYIVCIESVQMFCEDIAERTELVCKALSIALQQMHSYETANIDGEPIDEIIRGLISGTDSAEEYYRTIFDHIFKKENAYYYMAVARYLQQDSTLSYTEFYDLKDRIEPRYDRLRVIYFDQDVLILFTAGNEGELNRIMNQLSVFFHSYHMSAGLSNPFSDVCEIWTYYGQAVRALKTGKDENSTPLLEHFDEIMIRLWQIQDRDQRLKIGFSCGVLNIFPFRKLEDYQRKYSHIRIQWEEAANQEIIRRVRQGSMDGQKISKSFQYDHDRQSYIPQPYVFRAHGRHGYHE